MKKKAKRTPSTNSTSSRAGLVKQNDGWKVVSDVLLVCELLLFIALSTLAGKDAPIEKGRRKSAKTVCTNFST